MHADITRREADIIAMATRKINSETASTFKKEGEKKNREEKQLGVRPPQEVKLGVRVFLVRG